MIKIFSLLVNENQPGYHKVRHYSFKNFDGTGNDLGIEPIRIGVSTQADFISRSLVEYCYFTQCNGYGELISSKATQNVYRYNTFDDNPLAELVLRHGDENVVYGNFFLNGKGGVRIREGQGHYIYNNYFYNIFDRTIYIQNQDDDPLDNINIAYNLLVECDEVRLGGTGDDEPTNVTFANNIFTDPNDESFDDPTGNETWIGNLAFGDLGMDVPPSGMTVANPFLILNSDGYYGLFAGSPAVDAAQPGYLPLPQFPGMDPIDTDISFDIMQQARPSANSQKDLGPNEYPHNAGVKPLATAFNTGPWYLTGYSPYVTHVVTDAGLEFDPEILTISVGEQVDFQLSGTHNVVEMSASDYDNLNAVPLAGGYLLPQVEVLSLQVNCLLACIIITAMRT
jgi:hypothetical protein